MKTIKVAERLAVHEPLRPKLGFFDPLQLIPGSVVQSIDLGTGTRGVVEHLLDGPVASKYKVVQSRTEPLRPAPKGPRRVKRFATKDRGAKVWQSTPINVADEMELINQAYLHVLSLRQDVDEERADAMVRANIAAALPMQEGARKQGEVLAVRVRDLLARVPMLTASEVAKNAESRAAKPESLTHQWLVRKQVFAVELAGHGVRLPAFQFQPDSGKPWPVLGEVLPALHALLAPMDLLLWFDSPNKALSGAKPLAQLHNDEAIKRAATDLGIPSDFW